MVSGCPFQGYVFDNRVQRLVKLFVEIGLRNTIRLTEVADSFGGDFRSTSTVFPFLRNLVGFQGKLTRDRRRRGSGSIRAERRLHRTDALVDPFGYQIINVV